MKTIDIENFIKASQHDDFQIGCSIPFGYNCGLPVISQTNSGYCIHLPFLKYKVTGETDKTLVFPIKYVLTYSLPDFKPVRFEDFSYNSTFKKVDFKSPVGYFRHEAIKDLNKKEYKEKRKQLFSMYDKLIASKVYGEAYSSEEEKEFKELLNIILEPSIKSIYKIIDSDFYDKYLA